MKSSNKNWLCSNAASEMAEVLLNDEFTLSSLAYEVPAIWPASGRTLAVTFFR